MIGRAAVQESHHLRIALKIDKIGAVGGSTQAKRQVFRFFWPFAITLMPFAALPVENDTRELVSAFATVELDEDSPPVVFIIDEAQEI